MVYIVFQIQINEKLKCERRKLTVNSLEKKYLTTKDLCTNMDIPMILFKPRHSYLCSKKVRYLHNFFYCTFQGQVLFTQYGLPISILCSFFLNFKIIIVNHSKLLVGILLTRALLS